MIIQCGKCSTKFRLDDSRITGGAVKVRCTKCQEVFIVNPPPAPGEVEVSEVFGISSSGRAKSAAPRQDPPEEPSTAAARPTPRDRISSDKEDGRNNLKFDFGAPEEKKYPEEKSDVNASLAVASTDADDSPPETSFGGIDLEDLRRGRHSARPEEIKEDGVASRSDGLPANPEVEPEKDEFKLPDKPFEIGEDIRGAIAPPFYDVDFSFGDEDETEDKKDGAAISEGSNTKTPGAEGAPLLNAMGREEAPPFEHKTNAGEKPSPASEGLFNEKAAMTSSAPLKEPPPSKEDFSDILSRSISGQEKAGSGKGGDEAVSLPEHGALRPRSSAPGLGYIIAVLIVVIGGTFIYYSGITDRIARAVIPSPKAAAKKTVDIETISGYFAENKNFGRLFVIEAKLKNLSDSPQALKAVKGAIYNAKGSVIADRRVSPGRIVSPDDIKNLPKEDLLRPFRDPSGGTLPPKATVPVMVLFTEVPSEMAEYGLDIIR